MWEEADKSLGWASAGIGERNFRTFSCPGILEVKHRNNLNLFRFIFFLMKRKNFKWRKRTDLQHSFLVASKHGMGACQCDRKTLAILSFLKPGFDTNSLHTRQMYLIDSAFAPKQLPVCWNKHIEYVEERSGEHLIFTENSLCTRHYIRY